MRSGRSFCSGRHPLMPSSLLAPRGKARGERPESADCVEKVGIINSGSMDSLRAPLAALSARLRSASMQWCQTTRPSPKPGMAASAMRICCARCSRPGSSLHDPGTCRRRRLRRRCQYGQGRCQSPTRCTRQRRPAAGVGQPASTIVTPARSSRAAVPASPIARSHGPSTKARGTWPATWR
jgi:hypothetical protein